MNVREFPWSPVLAGFSSGVAGFAAAALATGVIHLGSAETCRLGAHQPGATAANAAHVHAASTPCPCCCEGRRAVTAAEDDGASLQLTAIEPPPPAWAGCEDDAWAGPRAVAAVFPTSDQVAAADDMDLARPVGPVRPLGPLTAIVAPTDPLAADPATSGSNPGRPTGPAGGGWSGLASPIAAPNGIAAALAGGSGGGLSGGGESSRSTRALAPIESAAAAADFALAPSRIAASTLAQLALLISPAAGPSAAPVGLSEVAPGMPSPSSPPAPPPPRGPATGRPSPSA